MKVTVEMPHVLACEATQCAYNQNQACHARAITVGHGVHPACDTYFTADEHARDLATLAGVGACKVSVCVHNRDYECHAETIRVGSHEHHADCLTFSRR